MQKIILGVLGLVMCAWVGTAFAQDSAVSVKRGGNASQTANVSPDKKVPDKASGTVVPKDAVADKAPATVPAIDAVMTDAPDVSKINKALSAAQKKLNDPKTTRAEMNAYVRSFTNLQDYITKAKTVVQDNLNSVQTRLDALGPAPADGVSEPKDIAAKRKEFQAQADVFKSQIASYDLILANIDELNKIILNRRNQELLNNILVKQSSIFEPKEFLKSMVSFASFLYDIVKSPVFWYTQMSPDQQANVRAHLAHAVLAVVLSLVLAVFLSMLIKRKFGYRPVEDRPGYGKRALTAAAELIATGLIPAAVIGAFLIWFKNNAIMNNGNFGIFMTYICSYLLAVFLLRAIIKVVFTPFNGKWRLIEVSDVWAKSLYKALLFSIVAISIFSFFGRVAIQTHYAADVIYALKLLANAVKAVCIVVIARTALYDNQSLSDEDLQNEADFGSMSFSSKASLVLSFAGVAAFVPSLFGYIVLSEFILDRLIGSGILIGAFYIVNRLIRVLFHAVLLLKFWRRTLRISPKTLVKTEFWFTFFLNPLMILLAGLFLLGLWGVSVDILLNNTKQFLTGFNIGGVRVSITSIAMGIVAFFVSMMVFKLIRNSLQTGALSKIDMDEGVRSSLGSGIRFLGIIASFLFGIAVMGGSLSSIAIVAGALSFGIGLGMQQIVSNFVSGIILLFERPLKVGDLVNIAGQEGIVRQINIRSTELETATKSSIIIPNATILGGTLINLTHNSRTTKMTIPVSITPDNDLHKVQTVLVDIAKGNKRILTTPAPYVAINKVSGASIDLEWGCYTSDIGKRMHIMNELRGAMLDVFNKDGIKLK